MAAGNNAVGVEAELLRVALAKSQFESVNGMLWSMVLPELQNKKVLHPQSTLALTKHATNPGITPKGAYAGVSPVWLVGGSIRRVQMLGSTLMRSSRLQQLEDNEAIIANVVKSTLPLQSDMRLLHCTNLQAKLPDQPQTHA